MSQPLQALYREHESIAAVLHALTYLAREAGLGKPVDTRVFRQILYYLDVFPERFHHPKEDAVLFAAIGKRSDRARKIIARLEKQHEAGAVALRELEQALVRWEVGGEAELALFVRAATHFVERYREHMQLEEDELMPLALAGEILTDKDWAQVEAAFARHRDPLSGVVAQTSPQQIFQRILNLAPPAGRGKPIRSDDVLASTRAHWARREIAALLP
jgi:hemerythrin-like domain-containing protein